MPPKKFLPIKKDYIRTIKVLFLQKKITRCSASEYTKPLFALFSQQLYQDKIKAKDYDRSQVLNNM